MGLSILFFLIPALVVMGIVKLYFNWEYTWKEFGVQAGGTLLVLVLIFAAGSFGQTSDTQLINGVVTKLDTIQESCQRGWQRSSDNFCTEYRTRFVPDGQTCSTNSNGQRSCTTNYRTEYKSIFEWERRYFLDSDLDIRFEIAREDKQGSTTPARFAQVALGDPVTTSQRYTNYIRGAVDSLFAEDEPVEVLPIAYPRVRDYYIANRVIFTGYKTSSALHTQWNKDFAVVNANIRKTGANAIIVVTGGPPSFALALAQAWEAHNINDVVTVIGMDGDAISWVDVRHWSSNSIVGLAIENNILALDSLDTQAIDAIIEDAVLENFQLRSMDEFEYLAEEIAPPIWALVLAAMTLLVVTPVITYMFHKHEVF